MNAITNFNSSDYLLYLLFYMALAATGVYLIADAIISGRPFQRRGAGVIIWFFQLLFGISLSFFPFYHLLTRCILKN